MRQGVMYKPSRKRSQRNLLLLLKYCIIIVFFTHDDSAGCIKTEFEMMSMISSIISENHCSSKVYQFNLDKQN